ncbi:MAG TPA: creatininase [Candidatus Binatia bacterium]|nr:creatininase [Candidatus Binatia bacterium]
MSRAEQRAPSALGATISRERVFMAELTWPEYAERVRRSIVILPVGSTEQHGPHLPLGADALQVTEVARRVALRLGAIVAPTIPYGYRSAPRSGGGEIFPGTTSLSGETLVLVVRDILRALVRHGARRIVVLDGHYENNMFLHEAISLVLDDAPPPDLRILKILWVDPIPAEELERAWPKGFPGWALEHAAHLETSTILALRPDLVDRAAVASPGPVELPPYDVYPQPPDLVPASGVLSDPSTGSAESGEHLIAAAVDGIVAVVARELGAPPGSHRIVE